MVQKKKTQKVVKGTAHTAHLELKPIRETEEVQAANQTQPAVLIGKTMKLGQILQKARQQQRIKIAVISKKLKIKEVYLEALENGHYYTFPALVYGVGFLRSYAQFLGLNSEELIQLFHKETTTIKEEPLDMPRAMDVKFMPSAKMISLSIIGLVVLYILINIIRIMTYKPIEIKVPTQPVVVETVAEIPLPVNEEVVPEKKELKPSEKEVQRTPKIYGLKKPDRISLVANQAVWIEVRDTDSNKVLLSKTLEIGDQYNPVSDAEGLVLRVANPTSLDIYQDGKFVKKLTQKKAKQGISLLAEELLKD